MEFFRTIFGGSSGNSLSAADAHARISSNPSLIILDVRQASEYQSGHIAGAKLIPLQDLPGRIDELPQDAEILCVCQSGSRSSSAVSHLTRAGYNAINLRGGMTGWQIAGLPVKRGK